MPRPINLDRLNNVDAQRAGMAGVNALNGLEKFTPEEQIAGLAMAFAAALQKHDARYFDGFAVARNLFTRASHNTPSVRAIVRYLQEET